MCAKAKLETDDAETRVFEGIMGYFLLEMIGFTEAEEVHIFKLSQYSMKLTKLKLGLAHKYEAEHILGPPSQHMITQQDGHLQSQRCVR